MVHFSTFISTMPCFLFFLPMNALDIPQMTNIMVCMVNGAPVILRSSRLHMILSSVDDDVEI